MKYKVPQGKPNDFCSMCMFLNIHGKMKPCDIEEFCFLSQIGKISKAGIEFRPIKPDRFLCPKRFPKEVNFTNLCKGIAQKSDNYEELRQL